jgi:hypothetical protein
MAASGHIFGHFLLPWPQIRVFPRPIFCHTSRMQTLVPLDPDHHAP